MRKKESSWEGEDDQHSRSSPVYQTGGATRRALASSLTSPSSSLIQCLVSHRYDNRTFENMTSASKKTPPYCFGSLGSARREDVQALNEWKGEQNEESVTARIETYPITQSARVYRIREQNGIGGCV